MKRVILPILLIVAVLQSNAQSTVLNNNPPNLSWYQVNTPNFRIVYQKGADTEAQRVANTLEHIRSAESRTLGKAPRKLNVILQSQSTVSNAFVSLTPRRSEFYMMPAQDYNFAGTNDWLTLLAVHEYRHAVQFENSITGVNKLFFYAFGPATVAGMASISVPQWFWEGDAVAMETSLTSSGRGRIPYFNMMFKTNLMEGRKFNYDKQYLTSYKHFIPNHYVLGYNMTRYLREKTNDPSIWGKVTKRTWNIPFLPFRFTNSIKHFSGVRVRKLYSEMADDYIRQWEEEYRQLQLTSFEAVHSRKNKAYTNYQYPQVLEDGSIVVMKSGIGDIQQLVRLKDGKEQRIFTQGMVNDAGMLSVAKSRIVWNEFEFDPRYRMKTYSVIRAYDVTTKTYWQLSKGSRYASAALSPDGNKVVTIETDNNYKTTVKILDFSSRQVIKQFSNPENAFYSMPRFSDDGSCIVVLKTTSQGKTICLFTVGKEETMELFTPSRENFGYPVMIGEWVYFNSPISGIDNIYAFRISTKQKYQITSSKYGAFNPSFSIDGKTMYYNEQTRNGLDVVKTTVQPESWKAIEAVTHVKSFFDVLVQQEGRSHILDSIPQQVLPVKKYSKLSGIIRPYSWGAVVDNGLSNVNIGLTSQNLLSTTTLSGGYNYNIAEKKGQWDVTVSYQGLYPIIDVSASMADRSVNEGEVQTRYIKRRVTAPRDTLSNVLVNQNLNLSWKEKNLSVGLRIPWILTRSKFLSGLTISNNIGYTHVSNFQNSLLKSSPRFAPAIVVNDTVRSVYPLRTYVGNNSLLFNRFKVNAFRYYKQSRRDFLPKWGQVINTEYTTTAFGSNLKGSVFAFTGQLFMPGLFKHHSLNGYWAYQKTEMGRDFENNYVFSNRVPVPRGLTIYRAEEFYSMSANYAMPLWYPDLAIGPLLNIQRVRLNMFYDYAFGNSPLYQSSQTYASVGGEVKFDVNIIRVLPQLDIGFRYSIGLKPTGNMFEFLIGSINF